MNLQISCINGNLKEVKEILKSNNFESTNPIYFALTKNPNIEILSLLLERFDVNLITQQNQISCLILACRDCPKYDVIKLLIEKGADCSFQVEGNKSTALHYALMSHAKYDVIELLIKSGCDLNHKTGYSPLHYACIFYNDPLIVDLIIKSGANIDDITGNTALHFACINKTHPDILHYLIKGGAQINKLNSKTPLVYAVKDRQSDVHVKILLEYDAQINVENVYPPLFYAVRYSCFPNIITCLLKSGSSLDQKYFNISNKNSTVLHCAIYYNSNPQNIRILLESGANPNAKDGNTPLHLALLNSQNEEIIKDLIFFGADVNISNGLKPIQILCSQKIKEILQYNTSFVNGIKFLLKSREMTDIKIQTFDKDIQAHEIILKTRLGEKNMEKVIRYFSTIDSKTALLDLNFIYTGVQNNHSQTFLLIFENKTPENLIKGFEGLILDFEKIYQDESTKDFTVTFEDRNLKVHKIILFARSELYRGMFLNVVDSSNKVSEYSGRSYESVEELFYFLYSDKLHPNLPEFILEELSDAKDYYQLDDFSKLTLELEKQKNINQIENENENENETENENEKENETENENENENEKENENQIQNQIQNEKIIEQKKSKTFFHCNFM